MPIGTNPIESKVASPLLAGLLAHGKAGGYPADIRMIYSSGGDLFNQCPNAGKIAASLDQVEFIVGQDHFFTPTVRHADIVLPATTFWERNDVHTPWAGAGHYAMCGKAFDPRFVFAWPTARYAVMSGDSAAATLVEIKVKQLERSGKQLTEEDKKEKEEAGRRRGRAFLQELAAAVRRPRHPRRRYARAGLHALREAKGREGRGE